MRLPSGAFRDDRPGEARMRAFTEFGTRALWNWRRLERPTITQALAIADSSRAEGNLTARALAVKIEAACRAAV